MYFCGWDGGGSSTKVCVLSADGAHSDMRDFGPLNPNGSSPEAVTKTISDCVSWMRQQPDGLNGCKGLVIGIAGVSNIKAGKMVENCVRA